jgi:hypothetical protein
VYSRTYSLAHSCIHPIAGPNVHPETCYFPFHSRHPGYSAPFGCVGRHRLVRAWPLHVLWPRRIHWDWPRWRGSLLGRGCCALERKRSRTWVGIKRRGRVLPRLFQRGYGGGLSQSWVSTSGRCTHMGVGGREMESVLTV